METESGSSDSEEDSSEDEDLVDEELLASWDPLCPIAKLTKEEKKCICIPWKRSVIIKLMGKRIGFKMLQNRLSKLWQPSSGMEIIDLENDYFLVRFSNSEDLNHVLECGPWMILDHYLVVQHWRPKFFPFEDKLQRVVVWIRIPGLPVEYYDRKILWRIGNTVGHTIKIDLNTLREKVSGLGELVTDRAKFARICVEVDLQKVLISRFVMNGRCYRVEDEGANKFNAEGDGTQDQEAGVVEKVDQQDDFGPWMLVQRGGRRNVSKPEVAGEGQDSTDSTEAQKGSDVPNHELEKNIVNSEKYGTNKSLVGANRSGISSIRGVHALLWRISAWWWSPPVKSKYVRKSTLASEPQSEETFNANGFNHESTKVLPEPTAAICDNAVFVDRCANVKLCANNKSIPGTKIKGRVGIHANSRVRFKGVKEAARRNASSPIATWPFVSSLEASLGRAHASSSKPPDDNYFSIPDAGVTRDPISDVPLSHSETPVNETLVDWPLRNVFPPLPLEVVNNLEDSPLHRSLIPITSFMRWSPPREGWVKWNVDGSVIGRQHQASSGCVLRDNTGKWLCGLVRNIGSTSVTCAELWAFKDATQASLLKGHQCVCFESDSTTDFEITHIHREGNVVADCLAKSGHHHAQGLHEFSNPPTPVSSSLLADCFGVCFPRSLAV
ncbi:Ribonuclease H-like superfamily [Sesbania bispinosa]|nr:Ribonuclease H-like superfamily [Sesbania bispinosa]